MNPSLLVSSLHSILRASSSSGAVVTPRLLSLVNQLKTMSTNAKDVGERAPPENYHDGHLLADHLEYIENMVQKSVNLEQTAKNLTEQHKKARQSYSAVGVKWMDAKDIDDLLDNALKKNSQIKDNLAELKALREEARIFFGVEGPDGQTDLEKIMAMKEVNRIIDESSMLEDKKAVKSRPAINKRAVKENESVIGVISPDGEADVDLRTEIDHLQHLIDDVSKTENAGAIKKQHLNEESFNRQGKRIIGVDSPDGISDDRRIEEMKAINKIIEDAATWEDKAAIIARHKAVEAIMKDRARDAEHDW